MRYSKVEIALIVAFVLAFVAFLVLDGAGVYRFAEPRAYLP